MSTTVASQSHYSDNTSIDDLASKNNEGSSKRKLSESSVQNSGEVADSEAETEQLHETPKKPSPRKRLRTSGSEADEDSTIQEQEEIEEETTRRSRRRLRNQQTSNDLHEENTTNNIKQKNKRNNETTVKKDMSSTSSVEEDGVQQEETKSENNHVTSGAEEDDDNNGEEDEEEEQIEEAEEEESDSERKKQDSIRQKAIEVLTDIEIEFAKFRDQLHEDRTKQLQAEIDMCMDGTHPDLQDYFTQLAEHRDHKLDLAKHRRSYQLECINTQTHASRDQLHQQFMKDQADARVMLLLETTKEWYEVNRERRAMDSLTPEFSFRVPSNRTAQIHQRMAVNSEVSLLDGISRYVGFPAAPAITVASEEEVREDFYALGV